MDNSQFSSLASVLSGLSQNPAALNALGSIMENLNKKPPPPEPKREEGISGDALLSLLSAVQGGGGQKKEEAQSPFGSGEDIKNRVALLTAVRPFLSERRRGTLELIIKLLRLSELGELTKLLGRLG